MVVGEAPGRLGADSSELPFHGDKAGHNFEALIELAGLSRAELFITNSVLCNPKDSAGNNSTPTDAEVASCAEFLRRQVDVIDPMIVVTLGATALKATGFIEKHNLKLRESVRSAHHWHGRELIPLYHPGQRAMIHRSFANQAADYQFLAERARRIGQTRAKLGGVARPDIAGVAIEILAQGPRSYFSLHKLSFLAEYMYAKEFGSRMTGAYYVRQKDGPYCVDLHPERLKRAGVALSVKRDQAGSWIVSIPTDLFDDPVTDTVDLRISRIVRAVIANYGSLTDARLKTVTYLTQPMRDILRRERRGSNQFNAPIAFID